ncbi:hypothetical protein COC42_16585 [Sphingomonas spermidinifaciens]|uniref:Glycosyl transferase family 1 n=2 Tax=Sphingomonas spermidinifaciens TaxID=1141889 RepID=A0A2A4B1W3_9SPHN|nr:hypothetical protein COC42_16585 [Sphingomonas spermidinifaciens]
MARILIVGKFYPPFMGGIEEVTQTVAEKAAERHDVTVLVNNHEPGSKREMMNGVKVLRQHAVVNYKAQPISLRMFRGIDLAQFDLVNFHSPNPYVNALFVLRRALRGGPPVVVTHHMDIYGRKALRAISLPFIRHLIRSATSVIITSHKNLLVSNDLPRDAHYEVVPLGLKREAFDPDDALRAEARQWRAGLSGDAPLVGFVGRIARYKGLDVLMRALSKLDGVHAAIGGGGEYLAATKQAAIDAGVADRVHFVGRIDHRTKLKLLCSIDAFVFPSTEITEAFGLSQCEAMLCGTPVVASDLPTGVSDVSIDGKTALCVPPGDSDALAGAIRTIITDRALADRLAAAGRAHVLENMTSDIMAARTLDVFERAMARQAKAA